MLVSVLIKRKIIIGIAEVVGDIINIVIPCRIIGMKKFLQANDISICSLISSIIFSLVWLPALLFLFNSIKRATFQVATLIVSGGFSFLNPEKK